MIPRMLRDRPVCAWVGVDPDGERFVSCDRSAHYAIGEPGGARRYSCIEHLSEVHAASPGGLVVHLAHPDRELGRRVVTAESAITWP
jgi:hypothetical protein